MRSLLPALALGLLSAASPEAAGSRHPVDGPDVDVRIQVQNEAVRFQIVMNLAYVDEIVDTPREDEFAIQDTEHASIRKVIFDFLKESNKLVVDGVPVQPLDRSFEVYPPDMDMLPLFPRTMEKGLTRVKLALDYPCKSPPKQVAFAWGEFPVNRALETPTDKRRIEIKAHLIARGLDEIVPLTAEEPEYTWHDTGASVADRFLAVPEPVRREPLPIPLVSAALLALLLVSFASRAFRRRAGRVALFAATVLLSAWLCRGVAVVDAPNPFDTSPSLPNAEQAAAIFRPLHQNIYCAFDYVEESEIYDALAQSVDGKLLDELYNQVYRSLIMHEEGGAVSRVEAVRPVTSTVETIGQLPSYDERPGFQVHARWQVDGVVRHWNHAHYRTNEYEARYTVVQADAGWRIADHKILAQKRMDDGTDAGTKLRPDDSRDTDDSRDGADGEAPKGK